MFSKKSHLEFVNQTYFNHFIFSIKWGLFLIYTGFISIIHGLFPFLFPFVAPKNVLKVAKLIEQRNIPGESLNAD